MIDMADTVKVSHPAGGQEIEVEKDRAAAFGLAGLVVKGGTPYVPPYLDPVGIEAGGETETKVEPESSEPLSVRRRPVETTPAPATPKSGDKA